MHKTFAAGGTSDVLARTRGTLYEPELREAKDALREIWTEANKYFDHLATNYTTSKNLHDIDHDIDDESGKLIKEYCESHNKDDKNECLSRHIAHEPNHLRNTNQHLYHVRLRNCEIFETIGVMVKRWYIDVEDVNRRFKYAADRVYISFRHHVAEKGIFGDAKPFDNAMELAKELKKK